MYVLSISLLHCLGTRLLMVGGYCVCKVCKEVIVSVKAVLGFCFGGVVGGLSLSLEADLLALST